MALLTIVICVLDYSPGGGSVDLREVGKDGERVDVLEGKYCQVEKCAV